MTQKPNNNLNLDNNFKLNMTNYNCTINKSFLYKFLSNFFKFNTSFSTYTSNKYIMMYERQNKINFVRFPLVFTNPRWCSDKNKIVFEPLTFQLEKINKK
jgi:hypothetical protein